MVLAAVLMVVVGLRSLLRLPTACEAPGPRRTQARAGQAHDVAASRAPVMLEVKCILHGPGGGWVVPVREPRSHQSFLLHDDAHALALTCLLVRVYLLGSFFFFPFLSFPFFSGGWGGAAGSLLSPRKLTTSTLSFAQGCPVLLPVLCNAPGRGSSEDS